MENNIIRFQNQIPGVYTSESRDFQILCRAFDSVFDSCKSNIDTILFAVNSDYIRNELLGALKDKLGLFNNQNFTDAELRIILHGLPYIKHHKGSRQALFAAINLFCKVYKIYEPMTLIIYNNVIDNNTLVHKYEIHIGMSKTIKNRDVLNLLLEYALPTGYTLHYYYFTSNALFKEIALGQDVTYEARLAHIISSSDVGYFGLNDDTMNLTYNQGNVAAFAFNVDNSELSFEENTPESILDLYEFTIDDDGHLNYDTLNE